MAFERARATVTKDDAKLAATFKDKENIHLTLAGEWRRHGSYMIVALREVVSRLETPAEIEAELRCSIVRGRILEHRLRERHRFIAELKSRNIHIDEAAGVWLTPDVELDRAEPKRAIYTVVSKGSNGK